MLFSDFAKYRLPNKAQIAKRRELVGESEDMFAFSREILEVPSGKRDRARRASNDRFSTSVEKKEGLCKDFLDGLYRDELYELAKDLELPVTKKTKKAELCSLIREYGNTLGEDLTM